MGKKRYTLVIISEEICGFEYTSALLWIKIIYRIVALIQHTCCTNTASVQLLLIGLLVSGSELRNNPTLYKNKNNFFV